MKFAAKVDLSKLRDVLAGQGTDPRAPNVGMQVDMSRAAIEAGPLYDAVYEIIERCKEEDAFDEADSLEGGDFNRADQCSDVRELALQSYPAMITDVSFGVILPEGRAFVRLHLHTYGASEVRIDGPRYKDYAEAKILRGAFDVLVSSGLITPEKVWDELFLGAVEAYRGEKLRELITLSNTVTSIRGEITKIDVELHSLHWKRVHPKKGG